ncbi:MAG: FG-GAP repeat protein [Chitinophagaceae bacterium]|nr:FG-GAP repeat protein [Chitinophagaceae bacterium]
MYKALSLAIAVSFAPAGKQIVSTGFVEGKSIFKTDYVFRFKPTATVNPFEPEKKTTEAWSQNWMAAAQENIRKSEYHFKWEEKLNAYCTPNRKNNLRFFYTENGFSAEPRTTKIPIGDFDPMAMPDEVKYLPVRQAGKTLPGWKIHFNLDKKKQGKGFWEVKENTAAYIADKITVQYINNDEGMRQNFIVYEPLSKTDDLKINFSIKTKLRHTLLDNQIKFFHKKTNVFNYSDLKVWDATGSILPASFCRGKKGFYFIKVDTKGAVYPITIDPISTTPNAQLESNQAGANMGFSVAGAGDVNGDGYSDVVVGVHGYDNPEIDEGAAFVYHGSASGISMVPAVIVENNQAGARLALSVSTAGDVNGDGYSDIIVGTPLYDNVEMNEGAFLVYHGSASGIVATPVTFVESNQVNAQLGYSVAGAGDVNGDGYSDVVVGAWLYDNPEVNEGVAFVYYGGPAGISTSGNSVVQADQGASNFGMSVAGAGDVNGDGFSDIIVGAEDYDDGQTDEGAVFIYHGSAAGIVTTAAVMLQENLTLSQYGFSVSSAGDVNGDGYSDVIVGAYLYNSGQANEGVAFVYHGSGAGITAAYSTLLEANQIAASFGVSVACAGDIDGDGYSDVIVGANSYDNGETNEGAAFVYSGSSTGINAVAIAVLEINQAGAELGRSVRSAGDVNGDGFSDVIVGAPQYDNGENNEGAAFVYHGSGVACSTPNGGTANTSSGPFCNSGLGIINAAGFTVGQGISYQWQYSNDNFVTNINNLTGQTNPASATTGVITSTTYYRLKVTCTTGPTTAYSTIAIIAVNLPTTIAAQPVSQTVCNGSNVVFSVTASGTALTYQWRKNGINISGANAATYTISNVATADAGNYDVLVSGSCGNMTTASASLSVTAYGTWLGAISNDWNTAGNWCGGIPTSSSDISISSSASKMPVLISGNGTARNIVINSGASLTVGSAGNLDIYGNLVTNGAFNAAAGNLTFRGSAAQSIAGFTSSNVTMNGSGGVILASDATVTGTLNFSSGHLTLGTNNLTLSSGANGSLTSHIITNATGSVVVASLAASTSRNIPVGVNAASYNPVLLSTNANHITDNFSVRVKPGVFVNGSSGTLLTDNVVDRTWIINESQPGGSNLNMALQWTSSQELNNFKRNQCFVMRHDGTNWVHATNVAATGSDPFVQTINGLSSFSAFAVRTEVFIRPQTDIYPTVAAKELNVVLEFPGKIPVTFSIYDAMGRLVQKTEIIAPAGLSKTLLNVESLNSGVHYLNISTSIEYDYMNHRFVKIN